MKRMFIVLIIISITCLQCRDKAGKFRVEEYTDTCPVKDLITEVPSLIDKEIVPVVLENESLRAVFDRKTGRLISFINKRTKWQIQGRGYLSRTFRLAVPLPGRKDNCVYGERQILKRAELSDNNRKLVFTLNKLRCDCGTELDIEFNGTVELTPEGLAFTASINNRSPLTVTAVYWPYLGDVRVPEGQKNLDWMYFEYAGGMNRSSIYPDFPNQRGYFGTDYPVQIYNTGYSPFGLLGNDQEDLYVCSKDTTDQELVNFTFELKPGWEYSESMGSGTVPRSDSIGGRPVQFL